MEFELGKVVITAGLDSFMREGVEQSIAVVDCFEMYKNQNWGVTCKEDCKLNDSAIKNNDGRIVAKYKLNNFDRYIFIITEWDRSYTTLMFCEEY